MKVAVTGATGLVGTALVARLVERGDSVVALSRDPARTSERLGVRAVDWDAVSGPAPAAAFDGVDGVIHLAGEQVAQRWSATAKERIRESRITGTANLVAGLEAAGASGPGVLVSTSAAGYYGDRGEELLDEQATPGDDFLASVCVGWEAAALAARDLSKRVAVVRIGVVLDGAGGALAKMLPFFKLGVGGPVAGGRQYVPWIALDDVVGVFLAALDGGSAWSGAFNASAPVAVTNGELSKALGRALHRPAVMPVPGLAVRLLYGEMASIVTGSQRMVPARARELGHAFKYEDLDRALEAALG
jgi:uncharacterized protein (TIGR01777 family)